MRRREGRGVAQADPPTAPQPVLDADALDLMARAVEEDDDAGLGIVRRDRVRAPLGQDPGGSVRVVGARGSGASTSSRHHGGSRRVPRPGAAVLTAEPAVAEAGRPTRTDDDVVSDEGGGPYPDEGVPAAGGVPVAAEPAAQPSEAPAAAAPVGGPGEAARVLAGGVLAVLAVVGLLALLVLLRGGGDDAAEVADSPAAVEPAGEDPAVAATGDEEPVVVEEPAGEVAAGPGDDETAAAADAAGDGAPTAGDAVAGDDASADGSTADDGASGDGTTAEAPPAEAPSVTVLNNSRVSGLAADTAATLESGGWEVAETGNLRGTTTPSTTVYFAAGLEDEASRLAAELGGARVLARTSDLPGGSDLVVVVTRDRA